MYCRLKRGKWKSLETTNLRDALRRLNNLDLLQRGLDSLGFSAKIDALQQQKSELRVQQEGEKCLAAWFANPQRRDFAT